MTPAEEFIKTAPDGLAAPPALLRHLSGHSRDEYILGLGFTATGLGPGWWAKQGIEISLPSTVDGVATLTRGDLFSMGRDATGGNREAVLNFVWHVLAWGSGTSRRHNKARIESIPAHVELLTDSFQDAGSGEVRCAYSRLIRRGGGKVPGLGPAFFTKLLYFASDETKPACLILDARVAAGLYRAGWSMSPRRSPGSHSYNWYTDTYVSYCELLHRWASEVGGPSADMLERGLFDNERWSP